MKYKTDKVFYAILIGIGIFAVAFSLQITYGEEQTSIPEWVKGIASYWVDGNITDDEFAEAIEFLLENEIITISGYGKIDIQEEEFVTMALTVSTDKETYVSGDIIDVSITLPDNKLEPVQLLIVDPEGFLISIMNVYPDKNGEYKESFETERYTIMNKSGEYIFRVQYKGERIETTIDFNAN